MSEKTKDIKAKKNTIKPSEKTATAKTKPTTKKTTNSKTVASKTTKNKKTTEKVAKSKSTKTTNSKAASKKSTTAKTSKKKTTATLKKIDSSKFVSNVEYYDLPYRYNQTVVKLLAQTPTSLFVYWDISDEDRENYKKEYGENFFETTHPVLIIHNDTMNYSFEVDINDFANSWYLKVNDSKCDYRIELGRRPNIDNNQINTNYIYISSSNKIESPNNHILFDKNQKMVYFRNVKTNQEIAKDATQFSFIQNMGKVYNIYDLYKKIYADENIEDFSNPSSMFK